MRRFRKKKTIFSLRSLFLLIIIMLTVFLFIQVQPIADSFSQNAAANAAVVQINDTIYKYLQMNEIAYDDIANLQVDENGHISAISIHSELLNRIKTGVASDVAAQFSQLQSVEVKLPVGSLFGNGLLSGKGFSLPITVTYTATVETDLNNIFVARGINQTQHRIILDIAAIVKTFSFGKEHIIPVSTHVTIAETVIVGSIPEIYAGADDELWPNLVE